MQRSDDYGAYHDSGLGKHTGRMESKVCISGRKIDDIVRAADPSHFMPAPRSREAAQDPALDATTTLKSLGTAKRQ